jgi:hypothetical protein
MIRKKGLGFRVLWVLGQTKTRFVGRGALTDWRWVGRKIATWDVGHGLEGGR